MKSLIIIWLLLGVFSQDFFPFAVKMLSKNLNINEEGTGKATLQLHIDKQGEILKYDILTFRFISKNTKYNFDVPYSTTSSQIKYPSIIKSNEKCFREYIKNKIRVKKISENNMKEDNVYLITVNLQ
jgi:hypothetical protein